ncbi:hypothetical protein SAMN05880590_110198 [Rhizobium sp. RU35A]|uniref:hypothetical protein n=1 Tax=Rhizobium sp. RU35A TaxID=1907414 RepID=UPI0009572DC7|nr:hypothetical protein [Rhizobium sp. RU35A]SIR02894.1 hypothetical protein SAMN05880590_110198 [Rhizobium sp. RU35A]
MFEARDRLIESFGEVGLYFYDERLYSSNAERSDIELIDFFLRKNSFKNFDICLARPSQGAKRSIWNKYYDDKGNPHSAQCEIPIAANSNHLKLTFAFATEQERLNGDRDILAAISGIRLMFGVSAARHLVLHSDFSRDEPYRGPFSEIGYASFFDSQGFNRFQDPPLHEAKIVKIPKEASLLLEKAFSQSYPEETFILMWLAFEAITQRFPGDNGGKKRESFFKNELRSDVVNKEIIRLSKVRHSLFKKGIYSPYKIGDDCWSLYKAMQIASLDECVQRQKFVEGYELDLSVDSRDDTTA